MLLLFASLLLAVQVQDWLPPPQLHGIDVTTRTVWFFPSEGRTREATSAYVFDKRSATWRRAPGSEAPPRGDSLRLADGFDLVAIPDDSGGSRMAVASARDNGVYLLTPVMTAEDSRRLQPLVAEHWYGIPYGSEVADLPIAGLSRAWVRAGDALWFGLNGGFTEGDGAIGGLLRFDLKTRRVESLWQEDLLQLSVTGLAVVGDGLWIGTLHEGEYGPGGWVGLLRYDLGDGTWARYSADTTVLPSDIVWSVAADGDALWVSTTRGVAQLDTKSGRWRAWHFAASLQGDSIVHEIVGAKTAADSAREAALALTISLSPPHPRRQACYAAIRLAPDTLLLRYARGDADAGRAALAQPELAPFVLALQDSTRGRHPLPGQVFADWRERAEPGRVDRMDAFLGSLPAAEAAVLARRILQVGDTSVLRWARRNLREHPDEPGATDLVPTLGLARDTSAAGTLFSMLHTSQSREAAIALANLDNIVVWRRLAREAVNDPNLWGVVLETTGRSRAQLVDSVYQTVVDLVARRAVRSADRNVSFMAGLRLVVRRDTAGMDPLIAVLSDDARTFGLGMAALIRATGVADVPATPAASAGDRARAREFWERWWRDHRTRFRFVSPPAGERALQRWQQRRGP